MKAIQAEFAEDAAKILSCDESVVALAVGGSWLTNEIDEFSDLDLMLISASLIFDKDQLMILNSQSVIFFRKGC